MSVATFTLARSELQDRLLNKVKKDANGCWLFTGFRSKKGYGQIGIGNKKTALTHRVSYELFCGPVPEGLYVLHKCDVPSCVNPTHLFLGTLKDNAEDAVYKRRHSHGEKHGRALLTMEQVIEIRRLLAEGAKTRTLASQFQVNDRTIRSIRNNESWTSIS